MPFPSGASGIDAFRSYSDIFTGESVAAINPEIIWGKSASYINSDLNQGALPPTLGGGGRSCVTQKVVDAYWMNDGRTNQEAGGVPNFETVASLPSGARFKYS